MTQQLSGWGNEPWGGGPWGDGLPTTLQVVSCFAVAENVFRLGFSQPVYYSGVLDGPDSSNPDLYQVTPNLNTIGYDGNVARPLMVLTVTEPMVGSAALGTFLDITVDRPMTPFPAQYTVSATGIFSADLSQALDPNFSSAPTIAIHMVLNPSDPTVAAPARDVANPQTLGMAQRSTIANVNLATPLGTYGYAADGDYGNSNGDDSLRERLNRRLFCKKDGFVHLPGYGVGITTYGKKLARPSTRDQLTADCQAQFSQEPEVAAVNVLSRPDGLHPELLRLSTFIKKKNGQTATYTTAFRIQ